MNSSHDYHLASEPDLKPSASRTVWVYFIVLGALLFLTIYGLDVFYRFTLSHEKEIKIAEVSTHESIDKKAMSEAYLSRKRGLFPDKAFVPINIAMAKLLQEFRNSNARVVP